MNFKKRFAAINFYKWSLKAKLWKYFDEIKHDSTISNN